MTDAFAPTEEGIAVGEPNPSTPPPTEEENEEAPSTVEEPR